MKDQLYKAVEINDEGSTEPVNYVGVYTLNWQKEWGKPEIGFTEYENEITDADIEAWAENKNYVLHGFSKGNGVYDKGKKENLIEGAKAMRDNKIKHIET